MEELKKKIVFGKKKQYKEVCGSYGISCVLFLLCFSLFLFLFKLIVIH